MAVLLEVVHCNNSLHQIDDPLDWRIDKKEGKLATKTQEKNYCVGNKNHHMLSFYFMAYTHRPYNWKYTKVGIRKCKETKQTND